jgi:hypothetical protein
MMFILGMYILGVYNFGKGIDFLNKMNGVIEFIKKIDICTYGF